MHIYLSGPMRGYPDNNFPAFDAASANLRARGHIVDSPAETGEMGSVEEYLRVDLNYVLGVEAVVVLPGWENSVGCGIELRVAAAVGTPVYHLKDVLGVREWGDDLFDGVLSKFDTLPFREIVIDLQPIGTPLSMVTETGSDESVCQEADRLVSTDRQGDYGHPLDDFTKTATMWSVIFGFPVDAAQVPLAMIAVKISRELNKSKRDNLVDICGYAKTLDLVHERRAQLEQPEEGSSVLPCDMGMMPHLVAQDALVTFG